MLGVAIRYTHICCRDKGSCGIDILHHITRCITNICHIIQGRTYRACRYILQETTITSVIIGSHVARHRQHRVQTPSIIHIQVGTHIKGVSRI